MCCVSKEGIKSEIKIVSQSKSKNTNEDNIKVKQSLNNLYYE